MTFGKEIIIRANIKTAGLCKRLIGPLAIWVMAWAMPSTCLAIPSITWSGPINYEIGMGPGEWYIPIDFDNNGVKDIIFRTLETSMYLRPLGGNEIVATAQQFSNFYDPISPDFLIDQDLASPNLWDTDERNILTYMIEEPSNELVGGGSWYDVQSGYLGVSFYIDSDQHYAWVRMSENNMTLTINDWAYETQPGIGISAGAGAVPEPATTSLLTTGLLALIIRKRKRKSRTSGCRLSPPKRGSA
jgi:PEP-CTERM motif